MDLRALLAFDDLVQSGGIKSRLPDSNRRPADYKFLDGGFIACR
jgi:hypothetical protein